MAVKKKRTVPPTFTTDSNGMNDAGAIATSVEVGASAMAFAVTCVDAVSGVAPLETLTLKVTVPTPIAATTPLLVTVIMLLLLLVQVTVRVPSATVAPPASRPVTVAWVP